MSLFFLEPVGLACEHLNQVEFDTSSNTTIVLGRNPITVKPSSYNTKYIEYVSRKQAELVIVNNLISIKPLTTTDGSVCVNGVPCSYNKSTPLTVGDTFSLLGSHGFFNFKLRPLKKRKVESSQSVTELSPKLNAQSSSSATVREPVSSHSNSQSVVYMGQSPQRNTKSKTNSSTQDGVEYIESGKAASTSSPVGSKTGNQKARAAPSDTPTNKIEEHLECVICFSHMAFAHSITPCGDSFCFECITSWSSRKNKCPNCQGEFNMANTVPNRVSDNIIRDVLERRADTEEGAQALKEWEQRVEQGKTLKKILLEDKNGASSSSAAARKPPLAGPAATAAAAAAPVHVAQHGGAAFDPYGFRANAAAVGAFSSVGVVAAAPARAAHPTAHAAAHATRVPSREERIFGIFREATAQEIAQMQATTAGARRVRPGAAHRAPGSSSALGNGVIDLT